MRKIAIILGLVLVMVAAGCAIQRHSVQAGSSTANVSTPKTSAPVQNVLVSYSSPRSTMNLGQLTCVYPAGWQAYTVQDKETADTVAAAFGLSVDDLLLKNCLAYATEIIPGRVVYVPVIQQTVAFQTVLPLSVTAFGAEPAVVAPGETVRLWWQGQGPVKTVRLGVVYDGMFYEAANSLSASGYLDLTIPDDGRDAITFMVRVGAGGDREVAAQTSVQVICDEGWFFTPLPAGCPSAPLVTTFYEQHFERGTIVYIPALGKLYVMVTGQEAVVVDDEYVPGMPLHDPSLAIPDGYYPTYGSIHYLWRHDAVRNALGYALDQAREYPGIMQRTVSPSGEVIYMSASSGHIYRMGKGLVWGVIIPV
jgi:hypothetical protein